MKVLIADQFETSWNRRHRGSRLRGHLSAGAGRPATGGRARVHPGRRARCPEHEGNRGDARNRGAFADCPRRGRRQHDRRHCRVTPRHLCVELSGQERDRRRRAHLRAHPRARPAHRGQRHRSARGKMEQEGIRQGEGSVRPDARHPWFRQHRTGSRAPGAGVWDAGPGLEQTLQS